VRLDDVEMLAPDQRLHGLGETAVTRGTAAEQARISGIAGDLAKTGLRRPRPAAGDQRHLGPLVAQGGERPLDETLGAADQGL